MLYDSPWRILLGQNSVFYYQTVLEVFVVVSDWLSDLFVNLILFVLRLWRLYVSQEIQLFSFSLFGYLLSHLQ